VRTLVRVLTDYLYRPVPVRQSALHLTAMTCAASIEDHL
jgi:hypothetical protein